MSALAFTRSDLLAIDKRLAETTLYEFLKQSWHVIQPSRRFKDSWHIKAICDHIQLWAEFRFPNLLINVPPRCLKSVICSVVFLPWVWTTRPHLSAIYASYSDEFSKRDQRLSRDLINSNWYRERWPHVVVRDDIDNVSRYQNTAGGFRLKTSVGGRGTGEGADYVICDDPLSAQDGTFSELKRKEAIDWWDETMWNRWVDPNRFGRLIIMQRLHGNDLSGHILSKPERGDYIYLCLPMEFDPARRCETPYFIDPRKEEGDLLDPRITREFLKKWRESQASPYAYAGQYQQEPVSRGNSVFIVEQLIRVGSIPGRIIRRVRYWDKAGTKDGGAYTAGALIGALDNGQTIILDMKRGQWAAPEREKLIKATAIADGVRVEVWVEQEPGSGGKESAENTIRNLSGFIVQADKVTGEKEVRAEPFSVQIDAGNVLVLDIEGNRWVRPMLDEMATFPLGRYKDQSDALAGAFNKCVDPALNYRLLTM